MCVCLDTRALSGKRRERTETSCLIGSTSFQQQEKKWGGGMAKFKNKKGEKNYRFSWLVILFTQVFFFGVAWVLVRKYSRHNPAHAESAFQCRRPMFQATTTQKKKTKQNKHPFYLLLFYFLNLCIGCLIAIVTLLSPTSFVRQEFQSQNPFFFKHFLSVCFDICCFPVCEGQKGNVSNQVFSPNNKH